MGLEVLDLRVGCTSDDQFVSQAVKLTNLSFCWLIILFDRTYSSEEGRQPLCSSETTRHTLLAPKTRIFQGIREIT